MYQQTQAGSRLDHSQSYNLPETWVSQTGTPNCHEPKIVNFDTRGKFLVHNSP